MTDTVLTHATIDGRAVTIEGVESPPLSRDGALVPPRFVGVQVVACDTGEVLGGTARGEIVRVEQRTCACCGSVLNSAVLEPRRPEDPANVLFTIRAVD